MGYSSFDGLAPSCNLVSDGKRLYGTTQFGGWSPAQSFGTIFSINVDGTGMNIPEAFDNTVGVPMGGLVLSAGTLYLTTYNTIFSIRTDGSGFEFLHIATGADGYKPQGGLVLSGGRLFGTTKYGGTWSNGTVYAINPDGGGYTLLDNFTIPTGPAYTFTNDDGAQPIAGLVVSGDTMFGASSTAGNWGAGTVFTLKTDGTGFRVLHHFNGTNEGAVPYELTLVGSTLYGTVNFFTGPVTGAKIYSIKTDGSDFRILCAFPDNEYNAGGLIVLGNALYGVTGSGGSGGTGTGAQQFFRLTSGVSN